MTISPASAYLSSINILHQEFVHKQKISSIEEAAEQRNQSVNQIIRSILFRLEKDKFVMILVAGKIQIDWKKLRNYFKTSRLTTASPEEVFNITGFRVGSVGPFGLKNDIDIYYDDGINSNSSISIGSGVRGTGIMMTTENLIKALGNNKNTSDFTK
jgi:prolyl-tRNA editing enzyme YbaK/EbsC (Cys-tRNA(Pro) deacylase)